jgi:hypothetical protein
MPEIVANTSSVRQAGRRYVPERARISGVPGGAELSGVTTVSDSSAEGVGLLQTYPIAPGLRFVLINGPERTAGQQYEVIYCQEHSGVFRIGARCVPADADSVVSPSGAVPHSAAV